MEEDVHLSPPQQTKVRELYITSPFWLKLAKYELMNYDISLDGQFMCVFRHI
jgi:hypothetical protein